MKVKISALCLFISYFAIAQSTVSGWVYEDSNGNSVKEKREKGVANVAVSNGVEVVLTDKNGRYTLPLYGHHTVL